jgi:hypothetical protein
MVSPNLAADRSMAEAKYVEAAPSITEGDYSPKGIDELRYRSVEHKAAFSSAKQSQLQCSAVTTRVRCSSQRAAMFPRLHISDGGSYDQAEGASFLRYEFTADDRESHGA